jgi:hypothetical protein
MNPCIRYKSLQMLLDYPQPLIDLHSAYCNMHIARHSVLKNIVTGKILDGSDAPTIKERRKKVLLNNFAHGRMDSNVNLSCLSSNPNRILS